MPFNIYLNQLQVMRWSQTVVLDTTDNVGKCGLTVLKLSDSNQIHFDHNFILYSDSVIKHGSEYNLILDIWFLNFNIEFHIYLVMNVADIMIFVIFICARILTVIRSDNDIMLMNILICCKPGVKNFTMQLSLNRDTLIHEW